MIGKELKIFLLLACVFAFTVAKPMIASKILLAINCGSKDQIVESFDKVFKYQPVSVASYRMQTMSQENQLMSTITPMNKPNKTISNTPSINEFICSRGILMMR